MPKKSGITMILKDANKLVLTHIQIWWQVSIDYKKLNAPTRKDHFSLSSIDQMLEHLAWNEYYYFLDGYSYYNQISIAQEDQEKTMFACPFKTFLIECPLGYAKHLQRFNTSWSIFFLIWWRNFYKSSWMIPPFSVILFRSVCTISVWSSCGVGRRI